jgi:general secretion pathway protein D
VTTTTTNNANTNNGTATTTGTTSTPGAVTLNKLNNLNANDFQVTIPGASLNFLASDSNTHIIQNPQIRIVDGQKASLKIGDKVPVATGSFQPGIGGVGINPLVNTQFQYLDVGVNIDVTPNIHPDGEVTLKVKLEVSSVTSHVNIGGIDQPVIGQRTVEHEVRLREGEVNLMGGIMEEQDVKSLSGWPFLSQVPILRYLFSSEHTEKSENEIVFALIPHIVRGPMITDLNTRALDVGTANGINLRPANLEGVEQPNGGAAIPNAQPPATPQAPAQQPAPAGPGEAQAAQPAGNLGAGGAIFSFDPAQIQQPVGSTFTMNVSLNNAQDVHSVPLTVNYDPKVLQLVNVSNGGFLGKDGQTVALVHREEDGTMQLTASRPPGVPGVSGQGPVFTLTFLAKASGQTTVSITRAAARNASMQPIPATGSQALVTVK